MRRIAIVACLLAAPVAARAQDVPGIEICTVEKTMERRTSCLQSNVDFLQKSLTRARLDQQQRLDAANRQIDALKAAVLTLQKRLDEFQASAKKPDATAKDAAPGAPTAGENKK